MDPLEKLRKAIPTIENQIGYTFKREGALITAFVHSSYANEHRGLDLEHNERLEFLGDSVFNLVISEHLYGYFSDKPEGVLSHLRSRVVAAPQCARFAEALKIEGFLLLGKGEQRRKGRGWESIIADLFEAVIGAIFIDGGWKEARRFIHTHFLPQIQTVVLSPERNWKADLQDYAQKLYHEPPEYRIVKEEGPEHSKSFHVEVVIVSQVMGEGSGGSKKEAEQAAAEDALQRLESDGD